MKFRHRSVDKDGIWVRKGEREEQVIHVLWKMGIGKVEKEEIGENLDLYGEIMDKCRRIKAR